MIDPFVLLTPILLLGVMALIRFVGCNWFFGIEETTAILPQVEGLVPKAGDEYVLLTWGYTGTPAATKFTVHTASQQGGTYTPNRDVTPSGGYEHTVFIDSLPNGTPVWFKVEVLFSDGTHSPLDEAEEVTATPHVADFLNVVTPGSLRNDFDGWVGMAVLVTAAPIIVTQLGRWTSPGNAVSHAIRIVDPGNGATLGMAAVSPGAPDTFSFVNVTQPVTLLPGGLYYIVSHESAGGDVFLNYPTIVQPIGEPTNVNVAKVLSAVYSGDLAPDDFQLYGAHNEVYGPVNFRY